MNRTIALLLTCACGGATEPEAPAAPAAPEIAPVAPPKSTPVAAPDLLFERTWIAAQEASPPPPPMRDPVADPSLFGPHAVGVTTLELTDTARDRAMLVDVWFPVEAETPGSVRRYAIETRLGEIAQMEGTALEDVDPLEGQWPLVLFSHGYGGIRFQSYFLTEHLASHGFVVAAPDHVGNRLTDFRDLGDDAAAAQSAIDRPLDMLFVRDQIVSRFTVDPTRVAMSGHSFGGWTTFEVGVRDPTIAVFVALAPGFRNGATPQMAADLERPLLIFGGSVDSTTPFEQQSAAYEAALSPKALVRIEGAGHLDFSNLCDIALARLFVDDGCDPDSIPPEDVQAITRTVATAFLGQHLRGDDYADYLDADYVEALGPVTLRRAP